MRTPQRAAGNRTFRENIAKKTLSDIRLLSLPWFVLFSELFRHVERVKPLRVGSHAVERPMFFTSGAERSRPEGEVAFPRVGGDFVSPQARVRGLKLCETSRCPTGNPQVSKGTRGEGSCSYSHAVLTSSRCTNIVVFDYRPWHLGQVRPCGFDECLKIY